MAPLPHAVWQDTLGDNPAGPRPPLGGDVDVDVAVVGGGYTGLWTAYELLGLDPGLRVAVLERHTAGWGASGRNGGWCSGLLPVGWDRLAHGSSREAVVALQRALHDTVGEVGRVVAAEGIDAHWAQGGYVRLATLPAQVRRLHADLAEHRAWGFGEEDLRWLPRAEAARAVQAAGVLGATFTPHCAAVHPLRLARGLARAVERRGGVVHEHTEVVAIDAGGPGRRPAVRTMQGTVRAQVVVRATEGFTATLPGSSRSLAPLYSLMVATEPLPPQVWDEVGLHHRPTFNDARHLIVYGQRTADGRLAFGGRGAPYHWGSAVHPRFEQDPAVHRALRHALVELFPVLEDVAITHTWGGPLGAPRDWTPRVVLHRPSGIAWAGGYVGDGVAASNLAGRTLAHLIVGTGHPLCALAWVDRAERRWEPEPLRWLGINGALKLPGRLDAAEAAGRRTPRLQSRLLASLLGH